MREVETEVRTVAKKILRTTIRVSGKGKSILIGTAYASKLFFFK